MILDKKHKTSYVTMQGDLHAVIPTTDLPYVGEAKRRLDRAFAQIRREYGIELEFSAHNPYDAPSEWIDNCRCHIEPATGGGGPDIEKLNDDLPKCTALENNKANTLEGLRRLGEWLGYADLWLHIPEVRENGNYSCYPVHCPFCDNPMIEVNIRRDVEKQMSEVRRMLHETSCLDCKIKYTWDFKKEEVHMTKVKS